MLVCWDGKSTDFTESMKTLTRGTSTRYKGYEYQVHQHEVSRMSPRFFFLCFCPFLILILSLWDNLKHARTLLTITDMHAEHQSESCQVNSYFWEEVLGENDVTKKNYLQFHKTTFWHLVNAESRLGICALNAPGNSQSEHLSNPNPLQLITSSKTSN